MAKSLVIVESPTKAKTIKKFLPKSFKVMASMGHVRDLPQSAAEIPAKYKKEEWAKIGVNVDKNFEPLYVISKNKAKILNELKSELKDSEELFLATDEDREGESISWHLLQVLDPGIPVKRMVFHEITKDAIQQALKDCREVDKRLVQAQETRRILDRLVGYSLSPLIWKKIAYGLSAGRVQSAGLRLIVERERERMRFKKAEYWDLIAGLDKAGAGFEGKLLSVAGERIATGKDFDETTGELSQGKKVRVLGEADARQLVVRLQKAAWRVASVEEKKQSSRPAPPFITSTLQQESNRKLGLSARDTMRIAQRLYEEGLITYMRTDSVSLSTEGIHGARSAVEELYGKEYLSPEVRQFKSKSHMAQEAHEAIRPAGPDFAHPKDTGLSGKEFDVYELIWKRTVATQMAEAQTLGVSVKIEAEDAVFGANGTRILFPGYLRAYVEGSDDPEAALGDREVLLPELQTGDTLQLRKLDALSHETKPPARYTEASLVQALEKEGIGRPSTYASIIGTIIERNYVKKFGNALVPTFTGFAVIQFLEKHFEELVNYSFTSQMEEYLDEIAEGKREWLPYLEKFYLGKEGLRSQIQKGEKEIDADSSRAIDLGHLPGVQIRIGRFGPYVVRDKATKDEEEEKASIPEDILPADLSLEKMNDLIDTQAKGPQSLGKHPETGEDIYNLTGRYGPYVQLGMPQPDDKKKPKRVSVPKSMDPKQLTLDQAMQLLSLPRELGHHPESGERIVANLGRFGPYIVHQKDFRSIKKGDDLFTIDLKRALEMLAEEKRGRGSAKLIRELGTHPGDEKPVAIYEGKYGAYVKHAATNVSLPKDKAPESLTLPEALELLAQKKSKKKKKKT